MVIFFQKSKFIEIKLNYSENYNILRKVEYKKEIFCGISSRRGAFAVMD
jgi:hypothetical protein